MSSNHGQIQYKDAAGGIGSARAAGSSALRLVSYNIHAAVGTDGRRDIDRIAAVIQEIDPDIIALQEVESRRARGGIDQARLIASALDMSLVEGPILEDGHGWYGNAILSKRAGFDVEHWRYPQHSGEPRGRRGMGIGDGEDLEQQRHKGHKGVDGASECWQYTAHQHSSSPRRCSPAFFR
jgi:hypothetical protein